MTLPYDLNEIRVRARVLFPERYAPDGTGLATYDRTCRHTGDERARGLCGDAWAHRLEAWARAQSEPEVP